jgi:hypothetical protein
VSLPYKQSAWKLIELTWLLLYDSYCTDLVVGSKVGGDHVGTVLWTRGDGGTIQRVYIAYSSTLSSIVVSYEGETLLCCRFAIRRRGLIDPLKAQIRHHLEVLPVI